MILPEGLVAHHKPLPIAHARHNARQVTGVSWDTLQQDALAKLLRVLCNLIESESLYQPILELAVIMLSLLLNMITITTLALASNLNAKELCNRRLVVMKTLEGEFLAFEIQRRTCPALLNLRKTRPIETQNSLNEPNIAVLEVCSFGRAYA